MNYILDIGTILIEKFGIMGMIGGALITGLLIALLGFTIVRGNFDMLKRNTDILGNSFSWKSTIAGIVAFILSIPLVIGLSLYAFGYWEETNNSTPHEWVPVIFALILILGIIGLHYEFKMKKNK